MAEPRFRIAEDNPSQLLFDCGQPHAMGILRRLSLDPEASPHWDVLQKDPLTVHPSIHCLDCGTHGWIQNGQWVPA